MRLSTLPEGVQRRVGQGSGERGGEEGGKVGRGGGTKRLLLNQLRRGVVSPAGAPCEPCFCVTMTGQVFK